MYVCMYVCIYMYIRNGQRQNISMLEKTGI